MRKKPPKVDLQALRKKAEEFVLANPGVTAAIGIGMVLLVYMTSPSERPAWLKDCPRVNQKHAGPWRGKGSFGKEFGPQVAHRR